MAVTGRAVRTPEKGERLLKVLSQGKSVTAACQAECIGRQTYYDWRHTDPSFAAAADQAIEDGTDRLEDIAHRRATKESDVLTIFLLKARRPSKYRETQKIIHDGELTIRVVYDDSNVDPA